MAFCLIGPGLIVRDMEQASNRFFLSLYFIPHTIDVTPRLPWLHAVLGGVRTCCT